MPSGGRPPIRWAWVRCGKGSLGEGQHHHCPALHSQCAAGCSGTRRSPSLLRGIRREVMASEGGPRKANQQPPSTERGVKRGGGGGGEGANSTSRCIQHSPGTPTTGLHERGNDTSRSTGRSGRQKAATRRNMRREERVTVQGPVKKQQPDGMSHRVGGGQGGMPRHRRIGGFACLRSKRHPNPNPNYSGGGGGECRCRFPGPGQASPCACVQRSATGVGSIAWAPALGCSGSPLGGGGRDVAVPRSLPPSRPPGPGRSPRRRSLRRTRPSISTHAPPAHPRSSAPGHAAACPCVSEEPRRHCAGVPLRGSGGGRLW